MIVCFLLAENWIAGCKAVQLAIWFWAGVSKLTVAFGHVIPVMTVNNPLVKSLNLRRRMFVSYPDDLAPSRLGRMMAYAGTLLELATPLTLLFVTHSGPLLVVGMILVLMLHGFILGNMPAGAVFEWNLVSLYAAFFLFVKHPEVTILEIGSAPLVLYLVIGLILLPLLGNLVPSRVSFLVAMRYYAGNWAWNAWLFRGDSYKKLEQVKRASPLLREQLERFAPAEAANMDSRGMAFRSLHLQGRTLGLLLPKAIGGRPFQEYNYVDGENVAGSVLGWNFGEGHLCDEQLLACVQEECHFKEGEVRAIMVESQPLFGSTLHWRIVDAKCAQLEEGYVRLDELAERASVDFPDRVEAESQAGLPARGEPTGAMNHAPGERQRAIADGQIQGQAGSDLEGLGDGEEDSTDRKVVDRAGDAAERATQLDGSRDRNSRRFPHVCPASFGQRRGDSEMELVVREGGPDEPLHSEVPELAQGGPVHLRGEQQRTRGPGSGPHGGRDFPQLQHHTMEAALHIALERVNDHAVGVAARRGAQQALEARDEGLAVTRADRRTPEQRGGRLGAEGEAQPDQAPAEQRRLARRHASPEVVHLLVAHHAVTGRALAGQEEHAGDQVELLGHQLGQLDEGVLARVQLVGGDGARLDLGLRGCVAHHVVLASDGPIVLRELALLHEEAEHQPQERERREGAVEELADLVRRSREEARPAHALAQVRGGEREPPQRHREAQVHAPVPPSVHREVSFVPP
jgi:hypothetical protein